MLNNLGGRVAFKTRLFIIKLGNVSVISSALGKGSLYIDVIFAAHLLVQILYFSIITLTTNIYNIY